jgi:DNA invertase Pin-like site-specific DNA recombinase
MRAVGYVRVSTADQADSGAGLEAQRETIRHEAARRGFELLGIFEDAGISGRSLTGRTGLARALEAVEVGNGEALIVAKLDRLSRSLVDFAALMERSRRKGWALIALDLGVDTTTPSGEMMANVLAVFAQFERRLIGQRTREALAVKKAEGVTLGRPRTLPADVRERIRHEREQGASWRAIAASLNDGGVPTAQGGQQWWAATVRTVALAA